MVPVTADFFCFDPVQLSRACSPSPFISPYSHLQRPKRPTLRLDMVINPVIDLLDLVISKPVEYVTAHKIWSPYNLFVRASGQNDVRTTASNPWLYIYDPHQTATSTVHIKCFPSKGYERE